MFNRFDWRLLQLFGGEGGASGASPAGDGGNGEAAPGEEGADAGHRKLRELGVPENKLRKSRNGQRKSSQQASAAENTNARKTEAAERMSWEEIVKDPEYNAQLQKIIRARVRDEGRNKAILDTLDPALRQLAKEHGLDPENVDHAALARAVTGEADGRAPEESVTRENPPQPDQRTLERQRIYSHILKLRQQEQAMKAVIPGFDLGKELRHPVFRRITSPAVGMSVEDAFYAVHRREIQAQSMQVAAQKTQEMISDAIRSGSHRPQEAGVSSQAPSVSKFDYRNATTAQRNALKAEIRRAAARGRKIYPG